MAAGSMMIAIMGRLVGSAKLKLVLLGTLLRLKPDDGNLVSIRRLEGSADVYSMVNVKLKSSNCLLAIMLAISCNGRLIC